MQIRPRMYRLFRATAKRPIGFVLLTLLVAGGIAGPVRAANIAVVWAMDPVHSSAEFSISHLVISRVKGAIPIKSGTIETAAGKDIPDAVEASLDPAGVDTRNADRDRDLRSPHYFDVQKYPNMVFKSTKVTPGESGSFRVDGALTLHGVTRPVILDAHLEGKTTDSRGTEHIAYTATTKFPRSDFGMTYSSPIPSGGVVVGNDVTINLTIEATPKRPS